MINLQKVSHNLHMIEKHCDRVIWMEKGKIKKEGRTREVVEKYRNEKTKGLNTCYSKIIKG